MNTNASNVEDIKHAPNHRTFVNVLHCIFWKMVNIFRNRSFALCKNDLDFVDMSDSAMVFESHIVIINNKSVRVLREKNRLVIHSQVSPFMLPTLHQISTLEKTTFRQHFNLSSKRPSQVSLFLVAAHSTSSEVFDFQIWLNPGLSDAVEGKHVWVPHAAS